MIPAACESQNILLRLRTATRSAHEELERKLDWSAICASPDSYAQMLPRFYGVVMPWESVARKIVDGTPLSQIFAPRWKSKLLVKPVLLVEDNPKDLELTLVALEKTHLANEVVIARDGEEALDYLLYGVRGETGRRGTPRLFFWI